MNAGGVREHVTARRVLAWLGAATHQNDQQTVQSQKTRGRLRRQRPTGETEYADNVPPTNTSTLKYSASIARLSSTVAERGSAAPPPWTTQPWSSHPSSLSSRSRTLRRHRSRRQIWAIQRLERLLEAHMLQGMLKRTAKDNTERSSGAWHGAAQPDF